ncbi:hypothetical protein JCM3765_007515 [Sporobolomyces pararoseus]
MASTQESSSPEIDTAEQLYHTAQHYIGQVLQLLETTVTKDEQLQHTSTRSAGSTLGKHLRHLHDHYRLLLDAIPTSPTSSSSEPLKVNYDIRTRNGDAESRHQACVDSFKHLSERLKRETKFGKGIPANRKVYLTALVPEKIQVESTYGRELWLVSFHAVHHLAIIKTILGELNLSASEDFGVAPSTLVHRKESTPNKL